MGGEEEMEMEGVQGAEDSLQETLGELEMHDQEMESYHNILSELEIQEIENE